VSVFRAALGINHLMEHRAWLAHLARRRTHGRSKAFIARPVWKICSAKEMGRSARSVHLARSLLRDTMAAVTAYRALLASTGCVNRARRGNSRTRRLTNALIASPALALSAWMGCNADHAQQASSPTLGVLSATRAIPVATALKEYHVKCATWEQSPTLLGLVLRDVFHVLVESALVTAVVATSAQLEANQMPRRPAVNFALLVHTAQKVSVLRVNLGMNRTWRVGRQGVCNVLARTARTVRCAGPVDLAHTLSLLLLLQVAKCVQTYEPMRTVKTA
jgi:hypothetical protein